MKVGTMIVMGCGMVAGSAFFILSFLEGPFLTLGIDAMGFSLGPVWLGVGFWEESILYTSLATFSVVFAASYYLLVERMRVNWIASLFVSAATVLSGAYTFEFVYQWFNFEKLLGYLPLASWWFNLLVGYVVILVFGLGRPNKFTALVGGTFICLMGIWYVGGFPNLQTDKTIDFFFVDRIGFPASLTLAINSGAKFVACLLPLSLFAKSKSS
jgi:hypothetical protein